MAEVLKNPIRDREEGEEFSSDRSSLTIKYTDSNTGKSQSIPIAEALQQGFTASDLGSPRPVYKTAEGKFTSDVNKVPAKISFNETTGDITLEAPAMARNNEIYQNLKHNLGVYSANYKTDHNWQVPKVDAEGKETGESVTLKEYVEDLNTPAKEADANGNKFSPLQQIINVSMMYEQQKQDYGEKYQYVNDAGEVLPVPFTNESLTSRYTVATTDYVDKVGDNTLQSVPQWFYDKYMKGKVTTYSEQGTVEYKDLMDKWYDRNQTTTEERASSFIELGNWIANARNTLASNPDNASEIMKAEALYEFLDKTDPTCHFWNGVSDIVVGAPLKAATSIATGLGEEVGTLFTWLGEKNINLFNWVDSKINDREYKEVSIVPEMKETLEQARLKATKWAQYAGTGDVGFTYQSLLDDTYAQTLTDITNTDYNESKAYTAVAGVLEFVGNMAIIIGVGNAVGEAATGAVSNFATRIGKAGASAEELWLAEAASGSAEASGLTRMLSSIIGVENTVSLTQVAVTALNSGTVNTIASLVGETLGEALVADPVQFSEILASNDTTPEMAEYLMETFYYNALGRGGEKVLFEIGNTAPGRAISANMTRRIYGAQSKAIETWEAIKTKLSKYKGLEDRIKQLEKAASELGLDTKAGNSKARKAQQLRANKLIRDIKKTVAEQDKIKWIGKDEDDILEALEKFDQQINAQMKFENMLDDYQTQLRQAKAFLRHSDEYPNFRVINNSIVETNEKLVQAEAKYGMESAAKTSAGAILSEKTNQYINSKTRLDILNNALKAKGIPQEAKAKIAQEIEHHTAIISKYVSETNPEVLALANQYATQLKTWYQELNNMRVELSIIDEDWLTNKREAEIWGEGGGDYVRQQRKQQLSDFEIRAKAGASVNELYDDPGRYQWGSTGDFVDPMLVMEQQFNKTTELWVRNQMVETYNKATGTAITLKNAETVRLAQEGKQLISNFTKNAQSEMKEIVNGLSTRGVIKDSIERWKNISTKAQEYQQANRASRRVFRLSKPTTDEAKTVVNLLADSAVENYSINDLFTIVYERGRALDVTGNMLAVNNRIVTANKLSPELEENITRWARAEIEDLYHQGIVRTKGLTDENLAVLLRQPSTDIGLKRVICVNDTKALNSKPVQEIWEQVATPARYEAYWSQMEREYAEHLESATKASIAANMSEDSIRNMSYDTFQEYKAALKENKQTQRLLKQVTDVYGKESPEAVEDFVLASALKTNKKDILDDVRDAVRKEAVSQGYDDKVAKQIANSTRSLVEDMIDSDFNAARVALSEADDIAKQLVDVDNWHKEIYSLSEELGETLTANNVMLIPNPNGALEAVQIDPLLAEFVSIKVPGRGKMNGFEKAQYLWMKVWRLGTTGGATGRSITNQYLRDTGNAWIMGNVTHLMGTNQKLLAEIFGENPAKYLSQYSQQAQEAFMKQAAETAAKTGQTTEEALGEVLAKSERLTGSLVASAENESQIMKLYRKSRGAWYTNGTVEGADGFGRVSDALDKAADWLNKVHDVRETYLRNTVYMNNLEKALSRNMSLEQARTYALFVSNNATTNFARGTVFMNNLMNTVPYLRATINGTKSFWRLWAVDPVGVTGRLIGGIVVPMVGLLAMSLSDEENAKVYKNFKEYEKEDALCFVIDGEPFTIPIPQEFSTFINPIRQAMEAMHGQSKHSLLELAANDIVGISPIDLSGFVDLDGYRMFGSDGSWTSRLELGTGRAFSQIAPRWMTAMATAITGKDLYTGKSINENDTTIDPDTGDVIPLDYTSGTFAKTLQKVFPGLSANIAQEVVENLFGIAGAQALNWITELGLGVTGQQGLGESVTNILEGAASDLTGPLTANLYDQSQSAWSNAVNRLYAMKEQITSSRAWSDYQKMDDSTPEKLQAKQAARDNLLKPFYDEVKNTINNLRDNYGQNLSQAKYASVISLMNFNVTESEGGAYSEYLTDQQKTAGKAAAIATMERLGFPSAGTNADDKWFTTYITNPQTGEVYSTYNSPVEILNMERSVGQAGRNHTANLRALIENSVSYDERSKMYDERSKAYDNKDYKKANEVVLNWDNKVISAIDSYMRRYGASYIINNDDVMDYLNDWIIVPSDWETNNYGKYISASKLNKQDGFIKSYLKYLYGVK